MATITRSGGIPVTVGRVCYGFAGGGYEGKTKELDELVKQEADILGKLFRKDIEIRFNSDRLSGGAWLKNSLKGFDGNCQVGLNAGLVPIRPRNVDINTFFTKYDTLPKTLKVYTYIACPAMIHPEIARCSGYDYRGHKTIAKAVEFLKAEVNKSKILK